MILMTITRTKTSSKIARFKIRHEFSWNKQFSGNRHLQSRHPKDTSQTNRCWRRVPRQNVVAAVTSDLPITTKCRVHHLLAVAETQVDEEGMGKHERQSRGEQATTILCWPHVWRAKGMADDDGASGHLRERLLSRTEDLRRSYEDDHRSYREWKD